MWEAVLFFAVDVTDITPPACNKIHSLEPVLGFTPPSINAQGSVVGVPLLVGRDLFHSRWRWIPPRGHHFKSAARSKVQGLLEVVVSLNSRCPLVSFVLFRRFLDVSDNELSDRLSLSTNI
jgi:hypothetical protein